MDEMWPYHYSGHSKKDLWNQMTEKDQLYQKHQKLLPELVCSKFQKKECFEKMAAQIEKWVAVIRRLWSSKLTWKRCNNCHLNHDWIWSCGVYINSRPGIHKSFRLQFFLKKKSKWWRHTQSYITRRKGTIMHTGESPVRSIIIVRPSSKNIAPKCCIAIPSWTDSVWISWRIDASPVLPSCRIRCAMCWNIILGIHKCHKYFQGKVFIYHSGVPKKTT